MSRPSKSRAIAIANPNLSREQLAAARKRERKAEEMRQSQLARQDDAVPTARKVGAEYPGGDAWERRPPQAKRTRHHDEPYEMNGTVLYRKSPTVGVGRAGGEKGDAVGAEEVVACAGARASLDRLASKAAIPREMVDAIGMQLGGCSVEEIAGALSERLGVKVPRSTVKGYLERGKRRLADAATKETT